MGIDHVDFVEHQCREAVACGTANRGVHQKVPCRPGLKLTGGISAPPGAKTGCFDKLSLPRRLCLKFAFKPQRVAKTEQSLCPTLLDRDDAHSAKRFNDGGGAPAEGGDQSQRHEHVRSFQIG
jgi:hypothetical protein